MTFPTAWQETALISIQLKSGYFLNFNALVDSMTIDEGEYGGEGIPTFAGGRIWKQTAHADGTATIEFYPVELDPADNTGLFQQWVGLGPQTATISGIDGDATTITVDTSAAHNLIANDTIRITGTLTYNGTYIIAAVTDSDTFTITDDAHNIASEATGTVTSWDVYEPLATKTTFAAGIDRSRDTFMVAILWNNHTAAPASAFAVTTASTDSLRWYAKNARIISHNSDYSDGILKVTMTIKYPQFTKAGTARNSAWESGDQTALPALTF